MGYSKPDPYYQPEAFGLKIIGEVQWGEPDYSFDLTVVWFHPESGDFFYAEDAGCSCPAPFEDFDSLEHLTRASLQEVQTHLEKRLEEAAASKYSDHSQDRPQVVDLLSKMVQVKQ